MRFLVLSAALMLAGCASTQPLQTASGRPEATISADKTTVKTELLNRAVNNRWEINRETDSLIVVQKANPDFLSNALLATAWDPQTELRIAYTLIPAGGTSTRVVADASIVANSGTAYERITPVTNNKVNEGIRLELENLKIYVEYHKGKPS